MVDENDLYSDDYYKKGIIQFSYNINNTLSAISPTVGLSDGSGYDAANFT